MCGRYESSRPTPALAERYVAAPTPEAEQRAPSWNVAPTQPVRVLLQRPDAGRRIEVFRWGLVPSWAKDMRIGSKLINARAETLEQKPAFRRALAKRRCVIPADAFYEWQRPPAADGKKPKGQPFLFRRADGDLCAFAGLWEAWEDPDDNWVFTVAVVTTAANADVADVHSRMPVILEEGDWQDWLDPTQHDPAQLAGLLAPSDDDTLVRHRVSTDVNRPANDGPWLVDAVATLAV